MNKNEIKQAPPGMPITADALKGLIKARPDRPLILGIVHVEDRYETYFGDGFYSSPQHAFLSFEAAQRCAVWVNRQAAKTHVLMRAAASALEVRLDPADNLSVPAHEELGNQGAVGAIEVLLTLLNGRDSGWLMTMQYDVGPDPQEPDFENPKPNDYL